jgi:hypothetical protein
LSPSTCDPRENGTPTQSALQDWDAIRWFLLHSEHRLIPTFWLSSPNCDWVRETNCSSSSYRGCRVTQDQWNAPVDIQLM